MIGEKKKNPPPPSFNESKVANTLETAVPERLQSVIWFRIQPLVPASSKTDHEIQVRNQMQVSHDSIPNIQGFEQFLAKTCTPHALLMMSIQTSSVTLTSKIGSDPPEVCKKEMLMFSCLNLNLIHHKGGERRLHCSCKIQLEPCPVFLSKLSNGSSEPLWGFPKVLTMVFPKWHHTLALQTALLSPNLQDF